ncbi:MucB/RseB C-terminal domain-containing protein [uncultured Zoogloea sp.]|jgi:sigma-E factor negative regulatory protein RseB|uniref:MucB/RseB C-terminal domain-containing protein n=1 Tax=uncultured Zoogloea sp. TaxID=160237 RepID=UPI002638E1D9|nr:MucB/RseB C-terminal domain-containing protein [uncultured Zoogloea sp.]
MKRFVVLLAACLTAGVAAGADASTDPLSWLGRISSAAHKLNYTGTFSYQSGKNVETSRIAHLVDGGAEFEKLEALDGSPREVVRNNEEVQCFLPDQKLVIVDQSAARRGFPARLPSSPSALAENYRIRKGEVVRIAGLESQQIILEPKDDMRFGHQFWADVNSGLLLRARLIGEKGESIEQFAFNEVQIGVPFDKEKVKPRFVRGPDWKVAQARGNDVKVEDTGWIFRNSIPGFRQVVSVTRPARKDRAEAYHVVFSDGLAAISVFIEPLPSKPGHQSGMSANGAVNIFRRTVADHQITALGEVPQAALVRIADGVEVRKR